MSVLNIALFLWCDVCVAAESFYLPILACSVNMTAIDFCVFLIRSTSQTSFDDTDQLDWQIFYWIGKEASVSIANQ